MAVTFDTDERGNFGIGGKLLNNGVFFDAGPLATPGFNPDEDFEIADFELDEEEDEEEEEEEEDDEDEEEEEEEDEEDEDDEDLEPLPSFILALLMVNLMPTFEVLLV